MQKNLESDKDFYCIGEFIGTFGKDGSLKFRSYLDDVEDLLKIDYVVVKNYYKLNIEKAFLVKKGVVFKIENFDNPVQSGLLVDQMCYVEETHLKKVTNKEYFISELIGMEVFNSRNQYIGKINNVILTGANDVWEILDENNNEILIPAIEDVVKEINSKSKKAIVGNIKEYL